MKKEFYFPSKDGVTQIHAMEWLPEGGVLAVLQIAHGMAEHIERYDEFASFLAENGIYVVGHSHLGHGKSLSEPEKLGYFHAANGNECVIGDIHELRKITRMKYPSVPYFLLGHSMGSFLLRQYLGIYPEEISGAIIMGTGDQPMFAVRAGMLLCKLLAVLQGWEYRSSFVNRLVIGNYEKKIGKAWLSRNLENVKKYEDDPLCGFVFTLNAFYHMLDGIARVNAQENAGQIPKEIPLFFVAGSEDPVGNNGKGVQTVFQRYLAKGAKKAKIKLYEENRHEILNELNRDTVYEDILSWINENVSKK